MILQSIYLFLTLSLQLLFSYTTVKSYEQCDTESKIIERNVSDSTMEVYS